MKKTGMVLGLILSATPLVLAADQAMDSQKTEKAGMEQMQAESKPTPPSKSMKMHKKKAMKKSTEQVMYRCPMDGYTSDKPGKCPKCGMDLEKVPAKPEVNKTM